MKFVFLIFKESLFAFNHLTTLFSSELIRADGSIVVVVGIEKTTIICK